MSSNTNIEVTKQNKVSDQIISALRELVITALQSGYNKSSYLVCDHVKYIKNIQTTDDPELYVRRTAKKLFPTDESYYEKVEKINQKFNDKTKLLTSFWQLYLLYHTISKEHLERRIITADEAENILDSLLV